MRKISFLLPLILLGCSANEDIKIANSEVSVFHAAFNQSNFLLMRSLFAPNVRKKYSIQQFRTEFSTIRESYGKYERSTGPNWDVPRIREKTLTITFSSMFEKAKVEESFTFSKVGSSKKIDKYSVKLVSKRVNF